MHSIRQPWCKEPQRERVLYMVVLLLSRTCFRPAAAASQVTWRNEWPDRQVGPDNFDYYYLGDVSEGASALEIDLQLHDADGGEGPLLCLRQGGPPLPSAPLGSIEGAARAATELPDGGCAAFTSSARLQLNSTLALQGSWWLALYTDPSPTRTQSKMIARGQVTHFSLTVTAYTCGWGATLAGSLCEWPVTSLPPLAPSPQNLLSNTTISTACLEMGVWQYFSVVVSAPLASLHIQLVGGRNSSETKLKLRWGALPSPDLTPTPPGQGVEGRRLVGVLKPKLGRWYMGVNAPVEEQACYSLEIRGVGCPEGSCEMPLQRSMSGGLRSVYKPWGADAPEASRDGWIQVLSHPVGPQASTPKWVYFSLDLPSGTAGQVLTVELKSKLVGRAEPLPRLLFRAGGLPSLDMFDFEATPKDGGNESSTELALTGSLIYPEEGRWYGGVWLAKPGVLVKGEALVRVETRPCLNDCSGNGNCGNYYEASRLRFVSWCRCDRTHGGEDCSLELLSPTAENRHVVALTVSNAAAAPASWWAFRHKAYPEWFVFTVGGIASAVYHCCDAGGYCAADYNTLQFADFFLSFFAVVVTCLHLAPLPTKVHETTQLAAATLLALIARDNATSGWNLVVVAAMGAAGLLLGWGLEVALARRKGLRLPNSGLRPSSALHFHFLTRPSSWGVGLRSCLQHLHARFHWPWACAGAAMLGLAKLSWSYETGATYWLWHSLWHVSIFSTPYFLLRATEKGSSAAGELTPEGGQGYERVGEQSQISSHRQVETESELNVLKDLEDVESPRADVEGVHLEGAWSTRTSAPLPVERT